MESFPRRPARGLHAFHRAHVSRQRIALPSEDHPCFLSRKGATACLLQAGTAAASFRAQKARSEQVVFYAFQGFEDPLRNALESARRERDADEMLVKRTGIAQGRARFRSLTSGVGPPRENEFSGRGRCMVVHSCFELQRVRRTRGRQRKKCQRDPDQTVHRGAVRRLFLRCFNPLDFIACFATSEGDQACHAMADALVDHAPGGRISRTGVEDQFTAHFTCFDAFTCDGGSTAAGFFDVADDGKLGAGCRQH